MSLSKEIVAVNLEDEMRSSYLDYAMSVIVGRALPNGCDGLKPVHRRILYAMFREGNLSSKRYSKCAGVVGEVLKKYHPHGDSAVYDSLVRMAQPWNLRYPLIDGQGNFGSIDGDSPAAYRYTECRLFKLAEDLMADIDKNTVDFVANFDESTVEPVVLPTRIPNLLINGSDGIAVGMATKIPPHNLGEVIDALTALVKDNSLSLEEIIKIIPGPDFPTGGQILGTKGIRQAYTTGRGVIQMRAQATIEPYGKKEDREAIIVTEIPYQVNKARLIESIANLVQQEKIEGISEIRDESDRKGMRVVIELKKGTTSAIVLNQLYKHTAMQSSFGIIMLTIVDGQPRILNLKENLLLFIDHRKQVIVRRTHFELNQAEQRANILAGLKIAVENIDEVVALIKAAKNPGEAKIGLIEKFSLNDAQAQAILEMRLQRLTGLERDKIIKEYQEVLELIEKLKEILANEKLVLEIIINEFDEIKQKYADARRTEITQSVENFSEEDLIQEEEMVVTVSHLGYIKRNPIDTYRAQRRGGRGKTGMTTRDEDFVKQMFVASTHDYFLVFTSLGRVHWIKVHGIPQVGRTAKGRAISNLIALQSGEKVATILPVRTFEEGKFIVFATKGGTTKKTSLDAFSRPRAGGIIAITIDQNDELVEVRLTDGSQDVLMSTSVGQTIRFNEQDVRSMGRSAAGVKGISLSKQDDAVVGMTLLSQDTTLLTVSEKGYGKRTQASEYRVQGRGGSGIITMKTTEKTGAVIATLQVEDKDDIMIVTNQGKIIRMHVNQISVMGRNTQGIRLIQTSEGEKVVSVAKLAETDDEENASE